MSPTITRSTAVSSAALLAAAMAAAGVTAGAQTCQYSVSPTRIDLAGPAQQGAIRIETQPGCAWTATVDANWLSLPAGGSGIGPGEVRYAVAAMDPAATFPIRQGRIRVRWSTATAGQDVLITQAIGTCRIQSAHFIEWNGTSPRTFGPAASGGQFTVLPQNVGDPWFVASAPEWIQVSVPFPGVVHNGFGSGHFFVQPNPSPAPRSGALQLCDGRTLAVSQAGRRARNGFFVPADFDDDGKADLAVYRQGSNEWYLLFSSTDYNPAAGRRVAAAHPAASWENWQPVAGDFDGDARNDLVTVASFRHDIISAFSWQWTLLHSSDDYRPETRTGLDVRAFTDQPGAASTADFDGDGKDEFVTYMTNFGIQGQWRISFGARQPEGASAWFRVWGTPDDIPLPADFDGDGRADLAVWRPSKGTWYVLPSLGNYEYASAFGVAWGTSGDVPVRGDFDGDGKADPAVWRPWNGTWYVLFSSTNYAYASARAYQWGRPGDIPVPNDYDGDGRTDIAVWRPENGTWYLLFSSAGYSYAAARAHHWGAAGDKPLTR